MRELTNEGWHVEAEGKLYRTSGALSIEIVSGVDWFGLEGGAQFGDTGLRYRGFCARDQAGRANRTAR